MATWQINKFLNIFCAFAINFINFNFINLENFINFYGYLENLSFGKLLVPSASLLYTVSTSFAQLEYIHDKIPSKFVKKYCAHALDKYAPHSVISCTKHIDASRKILISTVINIFYNNKQHQSADEIRKQKIHGFKKRQRAKE